MFIVYNNKHMNRKRTRQDHAETDIDTWTREQMTRFFNIINQHNTYDTMRGGADNVVCATNLYRANIPSLLRSHRARELYVEGNFRFVEWDVTVECGGDLDIDQEDLQPVDGSRLVTSGLAGCTGCRGVWTAPLCAIS